MNRGTKMPYRIDLTRDETIGSRTQWEPPLPYGPDSLSSCIDFGQPISRELVKQLGNHRMLVRPHGAGVCDVIGYRSFTYLVTEKVQKIIEELEPGIHHFYDIDTILEKTGLPTEQKYRFMHITQCANAVDLEKSDTIISHVNKKTIMLDTWSNSKCFLFPSKIGKRHLWRGCWNADDPRHDSLYSDLFCSDELFEKFKDAKITGWEFRSCEISSEDTK
ncbi:MAG: hypothetical protein L3J67_07855 [Hyphomicrobiaceae bacterium]|nr:hypothetical protein [Hyphomicrobiaceae bacterium]